MEWTTRPIEIETNDRVRFVFPSMLHFQLFSGLLVLCCFLVALLVASGFHKLRTIVSPPMLPYQISNVKYEDKGGASTQTSIDSKPTTVRWGTTKTEFGNLSVALNVTNRTHRPIMMLKNGGGGNE